MVRKANHSGIDNEVLITFIEKIENLNKELDLINADVREQYKQAKDAGYDPKYIRPMRRLRKMDADELSETDETTKMYRNALGL